jgi:hypothetical protein
MAVRYAGMDLAFARNSSSLAIVELGQDDIIRCLCLREWAPGGASALRPSEVLAEIRSELVAHSVSRVMADAHEREVAREHLAGCVILPAPQDAAQPHIITRRALVDQRLRLPDSPRLLSQMGAARIDVAAGGRYKVTLRQTSDGAHGDLLAALVLAVYQTDCKPLGVVIGGRMSRVYGRPPGLARSMSVC